VTYKFTEKFICEWAHARFLTERGTRMHRTISAPKSVLNSESRYVVTKEYRRPLGSDLC